MAVDKMTITILRAPHPCTTEERLADVKSKMLTLGPPPIHVVECDDCYMAIEGSHRLRAAADLGIAPILKAHSRDALIVVDEGLVSDDFELGKNYLGRAFVDAYWSDDFNPIMTINADGTLTIVDTQRVEEE